MSRSETSLSGRRPLLPPVYFLMVLALMATLHVLTPMAVWITWPWTLVGTAPVTTGLILALLGSQRFRRVDTTLYPFETSSRLVTDGVFRYSRNPMYLGMLLVLFGMVILLGSVTSALVLPLFYTVIRWRFVRFEEHSLKQQFGPAYHEYALKVRRWI